MIKEAVILAGGLGTRLKGVLDNMPKAMALISGRPFLSYILDYLSDSGISRTILATGYRHEDISSFFKDKYNGMSIGYSVEDEPLGTGGALLKATSLVSGPYFFVFNGDTAFCPDLPDFERFFRETGSDLAVALKPMTDFERYGSVTVEENRIIAFNEKKYCSKGLINGGVYLADTGWIKRNSPGEKFSFEKDILEKKTATGIISGYISDSYFIDIGIPGDMERARNEIPQIFSRMR